MIDLALDSDFDQLFVQPNRNPQDDELLGI